MNYFFVLAAHYCEYTMTANDGEQSITFSKKVDKEGRLVVPKEHRQALTIEGREALVEFEAKKITYLDGGEGSE